MNSLLSLFMHSLVYGLLLSAGLCILFTVAALLNPEVTMRGYPPDIKAAYGPIRPESYRQRFILVIPMLLFTGSIVTLALNRLPAATGHPLGFGTAFFTTLTVLLTFNLIDLLLLDWLLFVKIQPRFIILPGTAGLAGYNDYAFHFHGFIKGTIGISIVSLLVAGGVALFT